MNDNNVTAQLRDIKPLLEIPDSSYYIYWGIITFGVLLAVSILFFVLKKLWDNRKINAITVMLNGKVNTGIA